jgi:hypothetical protein
VDIRKLGHTDGRKSPGEEKPDGRRIALRKLGDTESRKDRGKAGEEGSKERRQFELGKTKA